MSNDEWLHSAHSAFIERQSAATVMRSAIWKYPDSAPEAPDKDVLVFSQDTLMYPRGYVSLTEESSAPLASVSENRRPEKGWTHKVYLWRMW